MKNIILVIKEHQNHHPLHGEKDKFKTGLTEKNILHVRTDTKPILLQKSKEIVLPKMHKIEEIVVAF